MNYANFLDEEGINRVLSSNNVGIPLISVDNKYLSISDEVLGYQPNNLVIASKGSNFINNTILPFVDNIINYNENFIIYDNYNIYESFKTKLENNNYKVISLDLDNMENSDGYNIFDIIENIYKKQDYKAISLLDDTILSMFADEGSSDPFWIISARNLFKGLVIYQLEKNERVNLMTIYKIVQDFIEGDKALEFLNNYDKESLVYINLSNILLAPPETRKSIISVFNQLMNMYLSSNELINIINNSDYDLFDLVNNKFVIFVRGNNYYSKIITNIIINQLNQFITKKCNIILPDFDMINPIKNFSKIINDNKNINYTITISSYSNLKNIYGLEQSEIIKMCFENTIYLYSQDSETLEEISYRCGNKDKDIPLISTFELLRLNKDEAIVLMSRVYPIKIKLGGMKNE